jgi:MFS family permease
MTTPSSQSGAQGAHVESWLPMTIILLAQVQMAFNVNALPVSIGPIVEELRVSSTTVGTALVVYSLSVAAFVMLGAKVGKLLGVRTVFQVTVLLHGAAMALMAMSHDASTMLNAQALAGLAAAALVPTLVVLIAVNYHGPQQAQALGLLAGASAASGVLAFLIAGFLGTLLSWRYSFGLLAIVSGVVFILSFRLKWIPRQKGISIDLAGAVLAAIAISLISFGFNNVNTWGLITAKPGAPLALFGLSPSLFMIVGGIVVGQTFFTWSRQRVALGKAPLLSQEVLDSRQERSAIIGLLMISGLGPAVNFLIPLYMQIVQGSTSLQTSVAVIPYTLAISAAAVLIVRFYHRLTPRQIGSLAFFVVAAGLAFLAVAIENQWGTPAVILALIVLGLGEGALLTLLFNVLVTASPKELASDVGALRGTAANLATALGTAFASVVAVGLLSVFVHASLVDHPTIPPSLKTQVDLDNINFVSNDHLVEVMSRTTATPEQVVAAAQVNEAARLRALRAAFLILGALALLAIVPAFGLPSVKPGEIPPESVPRRV